MSLHSVGNNNVIKIDYVNLLGEGQFCRVYSGVFDQREVAVKKVEKERGYSFGCEIEVLRQLYHPNVVRYFFTDEDLEYIYIVLEKCRFSLEDMLQGRKIVDANTLDILKQVSEGVNYLHGENIIHRNIHPSNILMSDVDGKLRFKISDFGVVKEIQSQDTSISTSGVRGTLPYISPELLKCEHINEKSDIFSLGLVFFSVLTKNKNPFGNDVIDIKKAIRDGEKPDLSLLSGMFSGYSIPLVEAMLQYQKDNRPGIHTVLAHYLFWNEEKTLTFIQKVSDDLKGNTSSGIRSEIEKHRVQIIGQTGDWKSVLFRDMTENQKGILERDFNEHSSSKNTVHGLLRQIRNWNHHYEEKEEALRNIIGQTRGEMLNFFTIRFPKMLPIVYEVYKTSSATDDFSQFY